jgi:hypothetical protein
VGGAVTNDFCLNKVLYGTVYNNLKATVPVTIGGLFYFEDGVLGTVDSNSN